MKLPRHAEIWLTPYVADRARRLLDGKPPLKRVWFMFADHWEPLWHSPTDAVARERVARWRERMPELIDASIRDSRGATAK